MLNEEKFTLIVYAGISDLSFDKEILKQTIKGLDSIKRKHEVIDFVKDHFDPTFTAKELKLYSQGKSSDENVLKYQKLLKECDEVIFIHEVINNSVSALTKGFFDKVFTSDGFWYPRKMGWFNALWGECTWIKRTRVFAYQEGHRKNSSYKNGIKRGMLSALKFKNIKVSILFDSNDKVKRGLFLEKVGIKAAAKL